jgi:DNA polymerase-1
MSEKKHKFVIIDGNALIHRAFHALPQTLTTKKGELVNAVYGFAMILLKVFKDLEPDYIACTFDLGKPTFRDKIFKEYKATRVKADQSLYDQIPRVKELVESFNIPIFEEEGYEADDVIGTLVSESEKEEGLENLIVTGDLDTLQLIDEKTKVFTLKTGVTETIIYDESHVRQRYGLNPDQMIDFKALRGDPSDNIPGVRGVGEKTALDLIKTFGSLEKLYQAIEKESPKVKKIKERYLNLLKEHKKEAFLSKKLATIVRDIKLKFDLNECSKKEYSREKVVQLFRELEFQSLLNKLPETEKPKLVQGELLKPKMEIKKGHDWDYKLIDNEKDFEDFYAELKKQKEISVDTEATDIDPYLAKLLGVSFSWKKGQGFFVDLREGEQKKEWLAKLKKVLEDKEVKKVGHNIKYDLAILKSHGINLQPISFDTMVAAYLLNPGLRQYNLTSLSFTEFGYEKMEMIDLIGPKGKKQLPIEMIPKEKLAWYSCEDADFTLRLKEKFEQDLEKRDISGLFHKMEMPLVSVLEEMEEAGIKIDVDFLKKMAKEVDKKIKDLKIKIYKTACSEFNINSPLQLKKILFEDLKISAEGIGKTKTGLSTSASELVKMKARHPIIAMISEYRELAKLKSTYLDALPLLVNPKTGRVHTSFNQTITATGRLSSSDPNLQNIPIRTPLGKEIRKVFIAENGFRLLSADYSQIELRIVASMANDEKMLIAFQKGEDIHVRTAAEVHEIALEKVTPQMRREAKAVNFGVIYGLGIHGLAEGADIPLEKARAFIEKYFTIHQGIQKYIENTKELAHQNGYVETLFGRRRYLPEINSGNAGLLAQAERMAINMPVQGTAADLMKMAMIEISKKLPSASSKARMILQVHDELVFEAPEKEVAKVSQLVKETMEEIYKLKAPIEVGISFGKNWGECK